MSEQATDALAKARRAASSPEARAKAVATFKKTMAEKMRKIDASHTPEANAKRAASRAKTLRRKKREAKKREAKNREASNVAGITSIPRHMIPRPKGGPLKGRHGKKISKAEAERKRALLLQIVAGFADGIQTTEVFGHPMWKPVRTDVNEVRRMLSIMEKREQVKKGVGGWYAKEKPNLPARCARIRSRWARNQ